jgi:hypothetical protein
MQWQVIKECSKCHAGPINRYEMSCSICGMMHEWEDDRFVPFINTIPDFNGSREMGPQLPVGDISEL